MDKQYIQIGTFPLGFQKILMHEFGPYSVAIGRVIGNDAGSFTPLGSGTIVHRGGRTGILTAHHCLHACKPEVSVGPSGTDTIALLLRGGRTLILKPEEVFEHPLASPENGVYGEWGPDLTFLQIAPGDRLSSLLACGSAWNLDRRSEDFIEPFCKVGNLIASVGYPEVFCETVINNNDVHRLGHRETLINVISEEDIEQRGVWDYLTSKCDYSGSPNMPASFEGVSGAGIWSMQLRRDKKNDSFSIEKSALVGVTFYQTDRVRDTRCLRGHFVRSLYDQAWGSLKSVE